MKKVIFATLALGLFVTAASAQQTRFYGANGSSLGTAVPYGNRSVRYYNSRGSSLGTSTTVGRTTTFYGPRGNVTGRAYR